MQAFCHSNPSSSKPSNSGSSFFLVGGSLLIAVALIPAHFDLLEAQRQRDAVLRLETHHQARVDRYEQAISAIERNDPDTIALITHASLGLIPQGTSSLAPAGQPADPMLFERLEPAPPKPLTPMRARSTVERLTTDRRARLWVIAAGAALALMGLLPRSR